MTWFLTSNASKPWIKFHFSINFSRRETYSMNFIALNLYFVYLECVSESNSNFWSCFFCIIRLSQIIRGVGGLRSTEVLNLNFDFEIELFGIWLRLEILKFKIWFWFCSFLCFELVFHFLDFDFDFAFVYMSKFYKDAVY